MFWFHLGMLHRLCDDTFTYNADVHGIIQDKAFYYHVIMYYNIHKLSLNKY